MIRRHVRPAFVLVTALAVALLPLRAGAAASAPRALFSLDALITVAPDLPVLARSVLASEAAQIWRREGVALRWVAAPESGRPSAPLRVLVISRRESVAAGTSVWTVGELVPHSGQRALAIASIAGAERVVKASGGQLRLFDGQEALQYRLGVVLGRAVAHEIGHYLLATPTHADSGLMRASIDAREFADPGARTFALDDTAGQWLRGRLLDATPSATDLRLPSAGFTYGQPSDTTGSGR
jgi:hypothetical protein